MISTLGNTFIRTALTRWAASLMSKLGKGRGQYFGTLLLPPGEIGAEKGNGKGKGLMGESAGCEDAEWIFDHLPEFSFVQKGQQRGGTK